MSRTPPRILDYAGAVNLITDSAFASNAAVALDVLRAGVTITTLRAAADLPLGTSRFGGLPDAKAGFEWPRGRGRRPLSFLAQIDLSEVAPHCRVGGLPERGWFYLFYDAESQPWDCGPLDTGFVFSFEPDDGQMIERIPAPPNCDTFEWCAVSFEERWDLPDWLDERSDALHQDQDVLLDAWVALGDLLRGFDDSLPDHHLLGHAQLIQQDPRPGLPGPVDDWVLLMQLDTDDKPNWMWGDLGRLFIWIRDEDLQRGAFDRVWMVLQCT